MRAGKTNQEKSKNFTRNVEQAVNSGKAEQTFDEIKNIAGQFLPCNSNNFDWLNTKLDLKWTKLLEKSEKKNNQKIET